MKFLKFISENRLISGIGLFVILAVISWPFILYIFLDSSEIASSERGQFGDMYGALTSLFSGLTLIFLVYTISQQNKLIKQQDDMIEQQHKDYQIAVDALKKQHEDLELNREELKLNREELTETRKEFVQQNKTLRYQRFESTFFNLLKLNLERASLFNHLTYSNHPTLVEKILKTYGTLTEMHNSYQKDIVPQLYPAVVAFGNSVSYFLEWLCKRKIKGGRKRYLQLSLSQFLIQDKEFLFYYLSIGRKHNYINEITPYLLESIPLTSGVWKDSQKLDNLPK